MRKKKSSRKFSRFVDSSSESSSASSLSKKTSSRKSSSKSSVTRKVDNKKPATLKEIDLILSRELDRDTRRIVKENAAANKIKTKINVNKKQKNAITIRLQEKYNRRLSSLYLIFKKPNNEKEINNFIHIFKRYSKLVKPTDYNTSFGYDILTIVYQVLNHFRHNRDMRIKDDDFYLTTKNFNDLEETFRHALKHEVLIQNESDDIYNDSISRLFIE